MHCFLELSCLGPVTAQFLAALPLGFYIYSGLAFQKLLQFLDSGFGGGQLGAGFGGLGVSLVQCLGHCFQGGVQFVFSPQSRGGFRVGEPGFQSLDLLGHFCPAAAVSGELFTLAGNGLFQLFEGLFLLGKLAAQLLLVV